MEGDIPINSLEAYPLRAASDDKLKHRLEQRGKKFWEYRLQKFVSYKGWDANEHQNHVGPLTPSFIWLYSLADIDQGDTRFMIDTSTFLRFHPKEFPQRKDSRRNGLRGLKNERLVWLW